MLVPIMDQLRRSHQFRYASLGEIWFPMSTWYVQVGINSFFQLNHILSCICSRTNTVRFSIETFVSRSLQCENNNDGGSTSEAVTQDIATNDNLVEQSSKDRACRSEAEVEDSIESAYLSLLIPTNRVVPIYRYTCLM